MNGNPGKLKGFESMIEALQKRGDLQTELTTQYRTEINSKVEVQVRDQNFPVIEKQILTDAAFLKGADIQDALTKPTIESRQKALISTVSVEVTKRTLAKSYQAVEGYRTLSEVKVFTDTGFKSKADWQKANPGKSADGYKQIGNKFVYGETDIDILIVKPDANGKLEIVRTEQIKAGKTDRNSEAQDQIVKTINALTNSANTNVILEMSDGTILTNVDYDSINRSKNVTRGLPKKDGFNEKLPLDYEQLNKIADEIEKLRQKGGI